MKIKNVLLLVVLLPGFLSGQYHNIDSLDTFIQKQVNEYKIPGVAIGIINDNKIVFKKGYGVISTSDSVPVTTQTIFPILSCTKTFTAAAIGILVDEGKLQWDDKVITHLPDFKLSDAWVTKQLTIGDILSHRSGLESFEGDLLWYGTDYTRQEVVTRIRYSPLRNNFRLDFGYQNIMYLVAGLIIEKVTGKPWDDFIKEKIFSPLSMSHSSTSIKQVTKDYARPHLKNKPIPVMNMDNIGPAGSVNSTIDDMLPWLQLWINEGIHNGNRLLSENSFQTITSPKIMLSKTSAESYGFGWQIETDNGKKVLSHGGGMPGYKSTVIIIPADKSGLVILTNKISYLNEALAGIIMEYMSSKKINWQEAGNDGYMKNFNFSWDEERDTSNKLTSFIPNLALYKGIYEDRAYGKAMISGADGKAKLELSPGKNQFTGHLYYMDKNRFRVIFNDGFIPPGDVIFEWDTGKKLKGFKLDIASSDFHFKYLNFKKK